MVTVLFAASFAEVRCIPCNKVVDDNHISTGAAVGCTTPRFKGLQLTLTKDS